MIDGDTFQKFMFDELHIRGEWVRLSDSFHQAIEHTDYQEEARDLLGQTIAASLLLTGTLKFEGRLSIHARGQGQLSLLMAEATNQRTFRGLASYEGQLPSDQDLKTLLGDAQLAITIDPDKGQRYQGIVPLERHTIEACIAHYFELSEQLDTHFFLYADERGCYGLMLQKLPDYAQVEDQDAWDRVTQLANTLRAEELKDVDNETMMVRLFHEESVSVYDKEAVRFQCSCSRQRSLASIEALGEQEALQILEDEAQIQVDCQFCNKHYEFDREDINQLFGMSNPH